MHKTCAGLRFLVQSQASTKISPITNNQHIDICVLCLWVSRSSKTHNSCPLYPKLHHVFTFWDHKFSFRYTSKTTSLRYIREFFFGSLSDASLICHSFNQYLLWTDRLACIFNRGTLYQTRALAFFYAGNSLSRQALGIQRLNTFPVRVC